jgi:hypothetical protein
MKHNVPLAPSSRIDFKLIDVEQNLSLPFGLRKGKCGMIAKRHKIDFIAIRQALLSTPQVKLPNELMSYGTIEVVLNGSKTCPCGI